MKNIFEEEWNRELNFWFSKEGKELQRCLVAQGYEDILFGRMCILFGNGFSAFEIIKKIRKEIK